MICSTVKFVLRCLGFSLLISSCETFCEESEKSTPVENKVKIEHHDASFLNMKSLARASGIRKPKQTVYEENSQMSAKSAGPESKAVSNVSKEIRKEKELSLLLYKNGLCLVKEVRHIAVKHGKNKIEFSELYPGLIEESIHFRTPRKGKITVLEHEFLNGDLSKEGLLEKSIGNSVFYSFGGGETPKEGKLIGVSHEKGTSHAVIRSSDTKRCDLVPVNDCIAVDGSILDEFGTNRLKLVFESEEDGELDLELSYLTRDISWKHYCLIEVFEKLDRIDVYSQAIVSNKTNIDVENATIIFDTSAPNFTDTKNCEKSTDSGTQIRRTNISIGKNSKTTCVLRAIKALKPSIECVVKIPMSTITESALQESELRARNMFTISGTDNIYGRDDFCDSEVLIFERRNNERTFLGKQLLSSIKRNNDFIFEIGYAPSIKASVRQIDFKNVSDKCTEYGVKLSVKNESKSSSAVVVIVDTNLSWNIPKKNFELLSSNKPMWRFNLENNESKDSYFRIRTNK